MATESWLGRGEMPDLENGKVLAPKSFRPWKLEEIAQLKASVPIRRNGWNTCAEVVGNWKFILPLSTLFFFALALVSPLVRGVLGLEEETATQLTLILLIIWVIPHILFVAAEANKIRPPKWRRYSLGDFYKKYGQVAAVSSFQDVMRGIPHNLPLDDLLIRAAFEVEYCTKASTLIVWRLLFDVKMGPPPVEANMLVRCANDCPVLVFDIEEMTVLEPPEQLERGHALTRYA